MGGIKDIENELVLLVELVQSRVNEIISSHLWKTQSDDLTDLFTWKGKPATPQCSRDELSSGTILQLTDTSKSIILRSKSRICEWMDCFLPKTISSDE